MAITAKSKGEARQLVPAGKYFGVCIGVYDIGTQPSEQYNPTHKVILQFELHNKKGVVRDKEDRALTISGFYPLSFGKKKNGEKSKLRQAVEGILGRSFTDQEAKDGYDVSLLLEKGCRLVVAHETNGDNTYDTIQSFMSLDEDDPDIEPVSNAVIYELDTDEQIPTEVPEWIVKQIKRSEEWAKVHGKSDAKDSKPAKAKASKPGRKQDDDDDDDDQPF
jgi:hypothetical protein